MIPSKDCIDLITRFEGLALEPYLDVESTAIGYGHQIHKGPPTAEDKKRFAGFSEATARALLLTDLEPVCAAIERYLLVPVKRNQFDALCSFVYNVGPENFRRSTLLKLLNSCAPVAAAAEFQKWNKSAGKVLPGLTARRDAEAKLFAGGTCA